MVNVAQQVGSTLGLAILVTVFTTASRHAASDGTLAGDAAARHTFLAGAEAALLVAAGLILLVAVVAATMHRPPRTPRPGRAVAPVGVAELD